MNVSDVVFRKDLYPRFKPNQKLIERYSNSIEHLPPIKVNQDNILIDGFHRWKAHLLKKKESIKCEVVETASDKEIKKLAYTTNSNHGLQLEPDEKKKYAQEMIGDMSAAELEKVLSVDQRTIRRWTVSQREAIENEQKRLILDAYLRAETTQQSIADALEVPRQTVTDIIRRFAENGHLSEIGKEFKPQLYNIWTAGKTDQETSHFGHFPNTFMENLIFYHTEPFDIVFDPFAGSGTTVDACQKWCRRFYCSDRVVKAGREDEIYEHDINDGLPENLPKPDLVFLDPPYWKQAAGKYSASESDLANMDLETFNQSMKNIFDALAKRKVAKIAVVISPTQYPTDDKRFIDHIFDFHLMLANKYRIEMRYSLPYSTQQYNGNQVNVMKKESKPLSITRDLVIWHRMDS